MLRNRLPLVFLGVSLLGASATWADEVGYIDCTNHPEETQVAAKAAKTQDVVSTMPCGQRFTILQSGFFFTRIQTQDGKVGYVYTNLISHDYSGNAVPQQAAQQVQASAKMAARSSNPLSAIAAAFKPKTSAPAESLRVPAPPSSNAAAAAKPSSPNTNVAAVQPSASPAPSTQAAANQQPADTSLFPAKSGIIVLNDTVPPSANQPKPVQDATTKPGMVKVGDTFTAKTGVVVQNETASSAPAQPKAVPAAPTKPAGVPDSSSAKNNVGAPTQAASSTSTQPKPIQDGAAKPAVVTDNFSAKSAVVVQNERAAVTMSEPVASQPSPVSPRTANVNPPAVSVTLVPEPRTPAPEPTSAQPGAEAFQPEAPRAPMEKTSGGGHHLPSIELFGGYSFARLNSGAGVFTNYSGGMGAVALNLTRWLQVTGDSSYNMIQSSGTKIVLYGNHYGPRLFWHGRNRWSLTPFVEGLFGGTRADTTVSGTGGYTSSTRAFSMKVGGGLDIRPSRRLEIRLFDADYYRTSFTGGTTPYQSNYWISTGVILRLFGRPE
jgi:hypothetical protein